MSKNIQRVAKLETGLTPKQAILLWFQEAHGFNTIFEYIHHLKGQPDSAAPIPRLTDQVAEAVKQTLKGHPREEIDKAVRQAYKDVLFLFFLHQQVNRKLISEERYFWTQGRFLIAELKSLLREQALGRRMRCNEIRVGIETPYPLDSETAAAVEAAKQHYVMTWELLEEGDDLGQWLLESFLAKGNTALPDGAYGLMVSILLPGYMYGRHHFADPVLAEPLEDRGLREVLEPTNWIDPDMAKKLAEAVSGLLANGVFDDLSKDVHFHELSQSRLGYGADVKLAHSLVSELRAKGLAKPSEDGVSVPLEPTVRATILVILAQLARSAGTKQDLSIHPATNDGSALRDLIKTLSREGMPSRDRVIAFDLEPVSFDMDSVPLDELLQFRSEHQAAHRAYMRDLRGFMAELADVSRQEEREALLLQRRQEISDAAHDLQRSTRRALGRNLPSWSFGLAGGAWSATTGDPLGLVFAALGLVSGVLGLKGSDSNNVAAYSYLFQAQRTFAR